MAFARNKEEINEIFPETALVKLIKLFNMVTKSLNFITARMNKEKRILK